jgi:hypothetical protein
VQDRYGNFPQAFEAAEKQYWPPMNADFGSAIQIGVHPRSSAAKLVLPFQREDDA